MATLDETFAAALNHHRTGDLVAADQIYRQVLEFNPCHAAAWQMLGVTAIQLQRYEDAVQYIGRSIQLNDSSADAHLNLGQAWYSLKQYAEATSSFRCAIELRPHHAMAHLNLGSALLQQGDLDNAIPSFLRALQLQPDQSEGYRQLAQALLQAGLLDDAHRCCQRAVELNALSADAHCLMGQILAAKGDDSSALDWYRNGLRLQPENADLHFNLARCFHDREQFAQALFHYEQASRSAPDFAAAHYGQGAIRYEQGELRQALKHYREALRLAPTLAPVHRCLGVVYQELGQFDLAELSLRDAIRCDPSSIDAYALLAVLLRKQLPDADRVAIRHLAATSRLTDDQRATLYFGLAQVDDARHDYAAAAEDLKVANSARWNTLQSRGIRDDSEEHDRFVDHLMAIFNTDHFKRTAALGSTSQRPVLIVGLPRSGTTLIEQILASHTQIYGAGELGLPQRIFAALPGLLGIDGPEVDCLKKLDSQAIASLAQVYLGQLNSLHRSAARIVDKLPDNYLYVGLFATLFPQGQIIHCRRDLRDVTVSCWMTDFRHVHWASRFDQIAARFHSYQRIINHWKKVLPNRMLDVEYEETVCQLEDVCQRLIQWCGLEWEPGCLQFHQNRRPVRTASWTEVRQPIYQRSVGRWKNYAESLAPLFELLDNRPYQATSDSAMIIGHNHARNLRAA